MEKMSSVLFNFDITGQGTIFDAGGACTSQPSMSVPTTPAAGRDRLVMEHDVRRTKTTQ